MNFSEVENLMPLVDRLAWKFSRGVDQDDYRSVALLALCEAVNDFDEGRGASLSTWAYSRLVGALKRHRQKTMSVLSYPDTAAGRESQNSEGNTVEIKDYHMNSEDYETDIDAGGLFNLAKEILTDEEYNVVHSRFILEDPMTLKDLALTVGISPQMVHKIEKRAMKKLRKEMD